MSYSPAELISYNLGQLRRHMTAQGCTDADWRAALERAAPPRWQPIETAPKDGTPVLVWADSAGWSGNSARVCAAFHRGQWRIYGPIVGEPTSDGKTRQWLGEVRPTHWMHIPAKPQPAEMTRPGDKVFDL